MRRKILLTPGPPAGKGYGDDRTGTAMNAEERKKHILRCAKKLFSRHGFYETQISDIITEADIARGTVYQYFKHKEDIFTTLLEEFYTAWERLIASASENVDLDAVSPEAYLRTRIRTTLLFFAGDNEMCNIVLRMGVGIHKSFDAVIKRFEKKIAGVIIDDLVIGQNYKTVRADIDRELFANIIVGALFRVSYYYFVQHKSHKDSRDIDAITDRIVGFISPGLFAK